MKPASIATEFSSCPTFPLLLAQLDPLLIEVSASFKTISSHEVGFSPALVYQKMETSLSSGAGDAALTALNMLSSLFSFSIYKGPGSAWVSNCPQLCSSMNICQMRHWTWQVHYIFSCLWPAATSESTMGPDKKGQFLGSHRQGSSRQHWFGYRRIWYFLNKHHTSPPVPWPHKFGVLLTHLAL